MRIRMLARSLAVGAVVVGLAGAGAASAQASAAPKHGKSCCSKEYYNKSFNKIHKENNKFHKSFNKKVHKTWNKVDIDVENNVTNSRISGNKYTEISPSATVVFGPLQSFNH